MRLENIIGIDALDIDVCPRDALTPFPTYDILVFDPGQMVGWAGYSCGFVYKDQHATGTKCVIHVGQGEWHECLSFRAHRVFVETTPYAARRTFDPWPMRFDGAVRAEIYPAEPGAVYPTDLHVAKEWFKLPRKHGLGRHAKDALTHLVGRLVDESRSS